MDKVVRNSVLVIAFNGLLLLLSLLLFTSIERILRHDKLLLHWYDQQKDLFSSDAIHTLTHHEPRSFGHSSALSLSIDPKVHGKILTRGDDFSFSITGNLINKMHIIMFSELFDSILQSRASNDTKDNRVGPCIKVSLAFRGMDMNITNSKDLFIHLPFQDNPPINVSLKIGDHFNIPPFSRCYIAMLTGIIGSCAVSKTANDMFVDFEEFQHSKEPSRFQSVSTMVYQEALFFYLDQDLSTTNNSSSYIASKPINGNDDVLSPAKMFSDGNKISPHALITNEGIALHTPIHSLMERNILGEDVFLYPSTMYMKAPKMDEKFPRHSEQVTVVLSINTRVYSWLEQMQLPYSFTFILNDQRADVTEPIRSQLVAEYTQHIGEATRMLDAYKQLLRSITRQDLSVLAEGESVRNMLSYFQLDDRPGAHNSAISSTDTILKAFTSVSLLINGDLPVGAHTVGVEMWCQKAIDSQDKELIASDSVRIHKL